MDHDERDFTLAQLVTHSLPERVVIGCVPHRIVLVSAAAAESDDYIARIDRYAQVIWIREDLKPPFAADALVHEIMHGCYSHLGVVARKDEEYTVNALASTLCSVLAANPEVTAWIAWALGAAE
jgi:hypothetical protein